MTIRSRPPTDDYRGGWDRVYGERRRTNPNLVTFKRFTEMLDAEFQACRRDALAAQEAADRGYLRTLGHRGQLGQ